MIKQNNERGYALIIVLFAIVFIIVITAVFIRGALSNATQEKTLDENNLVVVSAEAGIDYYTWELKQVFDKDLLDAEFTKLVNEAITAKELPINYVGIQKKIASNFRGKLKNRASTLEGEGATELFNDYNHELLGTSIDWIELDGDILLTLKGTVEGELSHSAKLQRKKKELNFELTFVFPKVQIADDLDPEGTQPPGGSLVYIPTLKNPKKPATPVTIVGLSKPTNSCKSSSNKITNQHCNISGINEASYSIDKSSVYIDNTFSSWGKVELDNSVLNIRKDFTPASIEFDGTELVVVGKIVAYNAVKISQSKIQANEFSNSGGTALIANTEMNINNSLEFQAANIENSVISVNSYKANSLANFDKADLNITTNYSSNGASFKNSILDIGKNVNTGGGLFYVESSNVKIIGNAHTANGSTINDSILNIGGYFLHTSKPLDAEKSDIFVGGKVTATNGTNFVDVNMIVSNDYESSREFKLSKTNLIIARNLTLGNGGTLDDSLLTAGRIGSDTPLVLNGSVVSADYLRSDIMKLNNSTVCAKDFHVRDLGMDSNSKVFYQNSTSHKNNNIVKLSSEDFEKTCGIKSSTTPEESEQPGVIDWKPPVLDKVIY